MKLATSTQQPERLAFMATRAGIRHGQTVLTDVDNVMVYPAPKHATREMVLDKLRFCAVSAVRVRQVLEELRHQHQARRDRIPGCRGGE